MGKVDRPEKNVATKFGSFIQDRELIALKY